MTISLRATVLAFLVSIALFSTREAGIGAKADAKIVVRIETASATRKGDRIVINVVGMGRTGAMVRGGGQLLRRGQKHEPNKDGLLEYELHYVPPPNYSGDKLKSVKASLVETNVPPGVKGVRIYAEYNERNAMLPESKVKERVRKKEEFLGTDEQLAVRKKEAAPVEERPKPKKEEAAASRPVVEEKKRGWNPFRRKPAPTPQPTPVVARARKPEPTPKKEEITRAKKEAPPPKQEEPPKKKRGLLSWNPFRRQAAPTPRTEIVVETKRPEPPRKKPEVTPVPAPQRQASTIEQETPPPQIEKKKRGWNLNPFRRKSAEPDVTAVPPPPPPLPPPKPEPTLKKEATAPKKTELAPRTEETPPKKEEVKKKKKKRWQDLNPLNWNPFKRKAAEPEE
jgi:hypothetical protein